MSSISHYSLISGSKDDWHGANATCSSNHALPSSFSLGPFFPTFEELVWTSQQTLKSEQERRATAAQSLPVCDCHGAASPEHENQRTMTPADRESCFHDTCHDTAAHDGEFIMEIISLFSHSAFTFLSLCLKYFTAANQTHSLKQTKEIFMCLVGSTQSSCIIQAQHDSHRAFFVTQVCTCVDLVSSYSFLFDHLHIFRIKLQNPSRRLKCILMGKWANPRGYLMNYHVKASVYDLSE